MNALNRPAEKVEIYKLFAGSNTSQMPKLLADGRIPLDVLGLWERRIDVDTDPEPLRSAWQEQYADTPVGIGYETNGDFQFKLDVLPILGLNKTSKLRNGALIITSDIYNEQDGLKLTTADRQYFGKPLTENEALEGDNPEARALRYVLRAEENPERAARAITGTFKIGKDSYGIEKMAAVHLVGTPTESAEMRAVCAYRIDNKWAGLGGDSILDDDGGRLFGVALQAQSRENGGIVAPSLDQIMAISAQYLASGQFGAFQAALVKLYRQ